MIVNPAIVGTGDSMQLNAAVVDLERLDLLGAMRTQPILQIDAGERRRKLTQICRWRADETRELTEAPMRRRDWSAVQRIAGNGTGDTRWKVPGVLDWSTDIYNPNVDVTQESTTLYASDRDVFLFLVDDLNPIETGRLPDGSPDLFFRGFYCWNSEVGAKTLGIASFYLRAVCQNRNLWGVEDSEEITIRHSKYAAARCAHDD